MADSAHTMSWPVRVISRTAARPHGWFGRVLARIWLTETAPINDHAVTLLDPRAGQHVLELGFGPGRTIGKLAERGATVTGVDISAQMLRVASRRNRRAIANETVSLHEGDGTSLSLPDGTCDGVLSVHNVYFWPDYSAVFTELARVLRPGGRLVLGIRDPELPPTGKADPEIYTFLSLDEIHRHLDAVGLTATVIRNHTVSEDAVWIVATAGEDPTS